jgi:hypothetical protein
MSLNQTIKIATISILALAPILSAVNPASAEPKVFPRSINEGSYYPSRSQVPAEVLGTDASYLGAGVNGGLTGGNGANEQARSGGALYGRFAIPQSKVSARGNMVFADKISAVTPKLTYDIGVAPGTNIFLGGGYNFVTDRNTNTPLGNKSTPVIGLGVESKVANNIVLFGGADLGLNAYENNNNTAISIQGGAGFQF